MIASLSVTTLAIWSTPETFSRVSVTEPVVPTRMVSRACLAAPIRARMVALSQ